MKTKRVAHFICLASIFTGMFSTEALAAWGTIVEAETGMLSGTAKLENLSFDSGQTVSFVDNGESNSLLISVTPPETGNYTMTIKYRSGENRNLNYRINDGGVQTLSSLNSENWTTFAEKSVEVNLTENIANTIKFFAPANENGPGIDFITFTKIENVETNPIHKSGYRLIFDDEFDSTTLDPDLWVDKYLSSWTKIPNLAQPTYEIKDGIMELQIEGTTKPWCPEYDGETVVSGFTTGNRNALHNWNRSNQVRNPIDTELTHINQYGYYEIRAKGQPGSSRHVAWWLTGFEDVPEESSEIDIFEILGNSPNSVPVAFHKWNDSDGPEGGNFTYRDNSKNFHTEYHTFGFDWIEGAGSGTTPDKMVFYVDGVKTGEKNVNIDYPMIQLFSLYEKRAGGWTGPWEPMPYPNTFGIDYVRVYKKIPDGYKEVEPEALQIVKVDDSTITVQQGKAALKEYTSQVVGEEGKIYTEKNLTGTKSYVNVTYNDGTVTQEFVRWDAITQEDLDLLNQGIAITKQGTLPNVPSTMPGLTNPTLRIEVTPAPPYDTNINPVNLDKLFDGDCTSTQSAWTAIMNPLPPNGYISYDFKENKNIQSISFSGNYGNGQGIRNFKVSYWNDIDNMWIDLDREYTIPWTAAGNIEAGETITVPLDETLSTSKIKINITGANTTWGNKIVMREIQFNY